MNNDAILRRSVTLAIAGVIVGETAKRRVTESEDQLTKQQIEKIVRGVLKSELEDSVLKLLKRELKSDNFDSTVVDITSRALAKFAEILFTRKGTWQSQLKRK